MGYQIKPTYWLKVETDKVEQIILMPKYWTTVWEISTLQAALTELGLVYTTAQMTLIGGDLVTRGVLESV